MKTLKSPNKTKRSTSTSSSFFHKGKKQRNPFFTPFIQAKLKIGPSGDKYEKEADRMADQVVSRSEAGVQRKEQFSSSPSSSPFSIQRLSSIQSPSIGDGVVVEEKQEEARVQTLGKANAKSEPIVSQKELNSNNSRGNSLGKDTQTFMESHFGADFSKVRIHDNTKSEKLTSSIQARAFTYGHHVYFNRGEYQPKTKEGTRVLAHELTHVVQQKGNASLKTSGPTIQKLGALGKITRPGYAPWGGTAPLGNDHEVFTDAGTKVTGWEAYKVYRNSLRYWCHGHSLGTFARYGYSVYSGSSMKTVIKDEWTKIAGDQTRAGDIAVWTSNFGHSAKFVKPVITGGRLDPDKSMLSTKNGQNALTTMSLSKIMAIPAYGSAGVASYRHK